MDTSGSKRSRFPSSRSEDVRDLASEDDGSNAPPSSLMPSSPPAPFSSDAGLDDDAVAEDEAEDLLEERELDLDEAAEDAAGIDLFGDDMEQDYRGNARQDRYSRRGVDDADYADMSVAERRRVDAMLNRRDAILSRSRGQASAPFLPGGDDDDDDENDGLGLSAIRRRRRHYDEAPDEDMDVMEEDLPLEAIADVKAESLPDWINQDQVRRTIAKEFKNFLLEYTDEEGTSVYGNRIRTLGEVNSESLEVSYQHLAESKPTLAYFLANSPADMLSIFDSIAMDATLLHYPDYDRIHQDIHVRITDLPTTYTLRELRQSHLNCLIRVSGVVTRRGGVFPQRRWVRFNCEKCKTILGPFNQDSTEEIKIAFCHNCQSRGPFTVNSEKTVFANYQKLTLQESPGTVPPGRLPRHREVIMLWDLVDAAKPGEEIEITGIYRNNFDASLNTKNGFPVFSTLIEANHVAKRQDQYAAFRLTEEDEKAIQQLAKDDRIQDRIAASIAPSIYGHEDIKKALSASLFGGVAKDVHGKMTIRGDINCLLLGDPGTAKSQFLKYVEKVSHRAVYTTGQGASAVGLTASVRKDPITGEWTLEGGALVLADRGVCLIDEFDKMNDQDRTSIHEAMEQQSISISKAGIVTSLQARCAVIAAANPIGGRYNATIPFAANVELTEPILSRFDVLCVIKDMVNPAVDERLAQFVVQSHARSHPLAAAGSGEESPHAGNDAGMPTSSAADVLEFDTVEQIPQEMLQKYIIYAREHVHPKINAMDETKIARLYSDMRRESMATGSFPVTLRFLESVIRLSEAYAKMRLSDYVSARDIDRAIGVSIHSFLEAQKISVKKGLARAFAKYTLHGKAHRQQGGTRARAPLAV